MSRPDSSFPSINISLVMLGVNSVNLLSAFPKTCQIKSLVLILRNINVPSVRATQSKLEVDTA